jgi:hypothetical protein
MQLGNTSVTNVKTSGTITAGAITIPNADGSANQVLKTDGSGTLSWGASGVFSYSMTCGTNSPKDDACKLGSIGPGGGWIFFVDYNDDYSGFDYLELAPQSTSQELWCINDTSTRISATEDLQGMAIGKGQANTNAIVASSVDGSNGSLSGICTSGAAVSAYQYVSPNGTSDWFLGSYGEMMEAGRILLQLGVIANDTYTGGYYWTSTGAANEGAHTWTLKRLYYWGYSNRGSTTRAIPIRAF